MGGRAVHQVQEGGDAQPPVRVSCCVCLGELSRENRTSREVMLMLCVCDLVCWLWSFARAPAETRCLKQQRHHLSSEGTSPRSGWPLPGEGLFHASPVACPRTPGLAGNCWYCMASRSITPALLYSHMVLCVCVCPFLEGLHPYLRSARPTPVDSRLN